MLFFCDDILKKPSASGGVAPRPLPGALPLDPTGGLLWPPDPRIIFLLFHFSPVPCLSINMFLPGELLMGPYDMTFFLSAVYSLYVDGTFCISQTSVILLCFVNLNKVVWSVFVGSVRFHVSFDFFIHYILFKFNFIFCCYFVFVLWKIIWIWHLILLMISCIIFS